MKLSNRAAETMRKLAANVAEADNAAEDEAEAAAGEVEDAGCERGNDAKGNTDEDDEGTMGLSDGEGCNGGELLA